MYFNKKNQIGTGQILLRATAVVKLLNSFLHLLLVLIAFNTLIIAFISLYKKLFSKSSPMLKTHAIAFLLGHLMLQLMKSLCINRSVE